MDDVKHTRYFPLTHAQRRVWYMEKINPQQSLHNIGGTVMFKGEVDFVLLEEAIHSFLRQNDGIRHRFTERGGEIRQYVHGYRNFPIRLATFSGEDELAAWVKQEAEMPFSLYDSDLFDFALFKLARTNYGGYFVKVHHIVADGWSMNVLTEQICSTYSQLLAGEKVVDRQKDPYLFCIQREQAYLASTRFEKNKQFWKGKFKTLPIRNRRMELSCMEGNRKTYCLSSERTNRIKQFTADQHASVYAFFVALYLIYHHQLSKQDDLIVGLPVLNRSGKKEKNIVGMLTSTMPFRHRLDPNMTVRELVIDVHRALMRCYFHQKYPFDLLVQDLDLNKKGYGDLFDTCVNYYNTNLPDELHGTPIENKEFYNGKQIYALQLIIREWSGSEGFNLDIDYKIQEYGAEQIEHMYRCLIHVADQMVHIPDRKLSEVDLLPEDVKHKLIYDFNATHTDYPREKTVCQLFEEQAAKTPDKTALCLNNEQLTYRQLNEKSNQLARYLMKKNVRKETIISLLTRHSPETIIGILGIMKAGAAYLPIDPDYPTDRIKYMLQDSGTSTLLTNVDISNQAEWHSFHGDVIQLHAPELYTGDASDPEIVSGPSDLAYVIYTSGSTGTPKGVMVEHQGLVNYTWWAKNVYVGTSGDEVFPLYSSLAFDLTVTSIFTPLISGNRIVIYPPGENEHVLYKIYREGKASILKLTPAHLSLLQDVQPEMSGMSSVKTFIVGGEDLKVKLAKSIQDRFGHDINIYNEYGPTETVVGCMIHRYDAERDTGISVPIGIPIQNKKVYLLDSDLQPVPVGASGEIYIAGDGVARGYHNKRKLTEEKFVQNPFSAGEKMYRSGDQGRLIAGNKMEYIGRVDKQVKIHGYRIELGEIEKNLVNHADIHDAAVVDREDRAGSRCLCAYYTAQRDLSASELASFLKGFLPTYMIPTHFIPLKQIPLTRNGKVAREALPDPEPAQPKATADERESVAYGKKNRPGTGTGQVEEDLIRIIRFVLGVEKVSMRDNFFQLGGDSIKAIQIASKLSDKGFNIKPKHILSNPVIHDMVFYLEKMSQNTPGTEQPCVGSIGPLPATSWFFSRNLNNVHHYTQSVLLKVNDDVNIAILETALQRLVYHHDAFRLNDRFRNGELYYNESHLGKRITVEHVVLAKYSVSEQRARLAEFGEQIKSSFRIDQDVLLKACLFDLGKQGGRLLMTAHHLAVDGVSWRIIVEDMDRLYQQMENKEEASLPCKTNSVQDWAKELQRYSRTIPDKDKQYWHHVDRHRQQPLVDFDLGPDRMEYCATLTQKLTEEETKQLLRKANDAYRTKANELIITALALVMKDYTRQNDVLIEIEGHGREEMSEGIDVSRTVGWFTSLYPVRLMVEDTDLSRQIKHIKDQLRVVPGKGFSHGVLKYLTADAEWSTDRQQYVRFNYLGDFNATFTSERFEFAEEYSGRENCRTNELDCLLDIVAFSVNNKLNLSVTYSRNKFKRETISQFVTDYTQQLQGVIRHCCQQDHTEFTPTDFETADLSNEELENILND